jgi:LmbE family N-acetylglucosaminyl deacetylase
MTQEADLPKRALVIGAHPDDNEFGAGGTVAKLTRDGWDVTFIIATNGNKGSHDRGISSHVLAETREAEQRAAAAALGVERVIFLRYNDGELEHTAALRNEMALYIRHFQPTRIYTHDPWKLYMLHPDHRAVGFSVIEGVVNARDHLYMPGLGQIGIDVWRPKELYLWSAEQPNYAENIAETLEIRLAALREHHTQLDEIPDLAERMRKRAAELGEPYGMAAAEAFRKLDV